ncbi:hypothetical protein VDP63_22280, partial [Xanthomonas campestris pv. campestris]|nr:hypothetical protein [Xanthomonas campestris pv. campestris]MEB1312326.1 hypothetical protein [Xanthomonas campestris pv. campestris]MEB1337404.1 hypothetical protein [Xanthomonas campestris pv. campestris]
RLLLIDTSESTIFHGLEMSRKPWAYQRQLAMMSRLHQLVQSRSQFLIATHSPILMAYPDACIYQIGDNGLEKVGYEDTEHYMVTKYFLNNYKRQIDHLLD